MIQNKESTQWPYLIFEVANTHGGKKENIDAVIEEFAKIDYERKAIKFHPINPEFLALPDYQWFSTYEELHFSPDIWHTVISHAAEFGDVWLDLFDTYGIEIYIKNKDRIRGIKLQASVIDNRDVIDGLSAAGIENLQLMINISGYEISEIEHHIRKFKKLHPKELILQIGYQAYPTSISDTGLQKIQVLKAAFPSQPLCFADHSLADLPIAQEIPVWAVICGCSFIEKHFCVNRKALKYDAYSSLEPAELRNMIEILGNWISASHGTFITNSEKEYLEKSYQAAVLRHDLEPGSMVGLSDLIFRRTGQSGMKWHEIVTLQSQGSILNERVGEKSTIKRTMYRRARIGVIVACRMKSSRLKNKAILPIGGVPSVERCLQNCLLITGTDEVILATSDLPEDAILENYTVGGKVRFWRGDPDDVIARYLGACEKYNIDVILRVTADCPVISPDIADILLKSHFETGADFTGAASCAVGSAVEVYNTETLRRVIRLMGNARHSEYMTWYMKNNPEVFKLNIVELPDQLYRDYRLTLDFEEDLKMFNRLFEELEKRGGLEPNLQNVFRVLDEIPEIPAINQNMPLRYRTDQQLIDMLNKVTKIHLQ
ncbi:MAG: N-acetylneuraminate synthase family protein [Deltaproteobacteria bacterium]|nr:N-acetylneuraminate synthase family protein [Deltaproteobacteria bacterium]